MNKITILFLLITNYLFAQTTDSLTLSFQEMMQIVRTYHPVVRQTNIGIEQANAELRMARSPFDPQLSFQIAEKTFVGSQYYDNTSFNIKIPTWYGVDIYTGVENLTGKRLDNSQTSGNTNFIGIEVPLLKDLLIDKRRAAVRQAKIMTTMSSVEQRATINDLLYSAASAYWEWVQAYQIYDVVSNTVDINTRRLDLIRKSFLNGERPAIDTVEALAQLQSFQYDKNAAFLDFQNAGAMLSIFLWQKDSTYYNLPTNVQPQEDWKNLAKNNFADYDELNTLLVNAEKTHPLLQNYQYKLNLLEIDRQVKRQDLLPKLNLKYNQLGKGYDVPNTLTYQALNLQNNFQYGVKLEMPLFFSQGRGGYRQAKLKIESTQIDQRLKLVEIQAKIRTYYNEMRTLEQQLNLQIDTYQNYLKLVRAEERRLENGESSIFLINARETKALESAQKLITLKNKYSKTFYALQWSTGSLQ